MDERFGRAERFLLVDRESGEVIETVDNTAANEAHGAGTSAASLMRDRGVTAVLSGRFGPKAFQALQGLGIETWLVPPSVTARQALERLASGTLRRMEMKVYR